MVDFARPIYINVRAKTDGVANDINRALRGSSGGVGREGENMGQAFSRGFNKGVDLNAFTRISNGLKSMVPGAVAARSAFSDLTRTAYTLGPALTVLVGGISSVIGSLGALVGAAGGAASTFAVMGNTIFALGTGFAAVKLALSGVGGALQKLNKQTTATAATSTKTALKAVQDAQAREAAIRRIEDAERALARVIADNRDRLVSANKDIADAQQALTQAIKDGREEIQQLGFDAEDAALNEKQASLDLGKAREALARAQDLPPNSRVRQEAELAYAQADLNYRKAKDANSDLAKEQDRLAKSGVNGLDSVVQARNRLSDAEAAKAKDVQQALQDQGDAERDLARAKEDANNLGQKQAAAGSPAAPGVAAGVDAWDAGLNDAQRKFVLFLQSLKPKLDELKNIAAEAFLPKLQQAIQLLVDKGYPTLAHGIGIVASAMGDASITLAQAITDAKNLANLDSLFKSSGDLLRTLASAIGSLYGAALSILVATAPIAQRFFEFLDKKFAAFDGYLKSVEGNKALNKFFADAEYTASQFGAVFGNLFKGVGAVIQANIGPGTGGDILLKWLKQVTSGFGTGNNAGLVKYFQDVATNATHVLDAVGKLVGVLGSLGQNQNIGKTFDVLQQGAPALESLLQKTADSGPKFAGLIVTITKIIDVMTDSGAMDVFFGTLKDIADKVLKFVSDPKVKGFLDFWGRIHAQFLALGLVAKLVDFGFRIIMGSAIAIIKPITGVVTVFKLLTGAKAKDIILTGRIVALYAVDYAKALAGMMVQMGQWIGMKAKEYAALVLSKGALIAQKGAMIASSVASKVAAGAQRLFNAAMDANPIGIIVIAIAALVAGLIWFFTQTKLGREIWANFTKFLVEAWQNTTKWIGEALDNMGKFFSDVITNVVSFVHDHWGLLLSFIIGPLGLAIQWIVDNWSGIVKFFSDTWNNILGFFGAAWKWIDDNIFKPFAFGMQVLRAGFQIEGKVIAEVWKAIQGAIDAVWKWIAKYVFKPIGDAFHLVGLVFQAEGKIIAAVWKAIQDAVNVAWKWIDKYVFGPIKDAFHLVGLVFQAEGKIIGAVWQGIQDALNNTWKWIDKNVFDPIKHAVGLVRQAFENAGTGIGKAWEGLRKAAAVPVNFIIDTVYNRGIRSFWNGIADKVGLGKLKLPKADTVKFASGGVMPGYSPGKDIHKFYSPTGGYLHLSGGEAIMRPEWTRAVGGPRAVERMNRAARKGGRGSGGAYSTGGVYTQRYASGGIVDFVGDLVNGAVGAGKAVASFIADPLKAVKDLVVKGIINPLMGGHQDNAFEKLLAGMPLAVAKGLGDTVKKLFGAGQAKPAASAGMGWEAMWKIIHNQFPSATLNSAYRPGAVTATGFQSLHSLGRAVDVTASMDIFNWLRSAFPNSTELIYSPAGARQLHYGKDYLWPEPIKSQHYSHVHWGMKYGGTVSPSPDGTIVRVAEAGKPERVEPLDPNGLSDRDKAMIELLAGDGKGATINVYQQPGEDGEVLAERVSRYIAKNMRRGGNS